MFSTYDCRKYNRSFIKGHANLHPPPAVVYHDTVPCLVLVVRIRRRVCDSATDQNISLELPHVQRRGGRHTRGHCGEGFDVLFCRETWVADVPVALETAEAGHASGLADVA